MPRPRCAVRRSCCSPSCSAQGVIGYTQYFLHVPPLLVGLHMLGACLVWLAALQVLLSGRVVVARQNSWVSV